MAGKRSRNTSEIEQHINQVAHPPQSGAHFAQSAKQQKGYVSPTSTSFSARRPQGRKRRESGGATGVSPQNIPQDAKRLRSAKRDAEPLCMSEDVLGRSPVAPPDSRWEF